MSRGPPGPLGRETGMSDSSEPIFISYAGPDKEWAEWVAWHLQENGYRVELDRWHWRTGDDFVTKMSRALDQASAVVAVFSPRYFEAGRYTEEEWTSAIARRGRQSRQAAHRDGPGRRGRATPPRHEDPCTEGPGSGPLALLRRHTRSRRHPRSPRPPVRGGQTQSIRPTQRHPEEALTLTDASAPPSPPCPPRSAPHEPQSPPHPTPPSPQPAPPPGCPGRSPWRTDRP